MIEASAALPPCRPDKRGRHAIMLVLPGSDKGDITGVCANCGTVMRVPARGSLFPMDDLLAVAEARRIMGIPE